MFDEIVKKIAALGVPGLILIVVIGASGLTGAAGRTVNKMTDRPFCRL